MNSKEYGRAISVLEDEARDESRPPLERAEYCEWVAECHSKLEDYQESGNWYLEAVKRILSQKVEMKFKARQAVKLSDMALEKYKLGGTTVDVLEAGKLKQRLLELSK